MCEQPTIFWCSCPCKLLNKFVIAPKNIKKSKMMLEETMRNLRKYNESQSLKSWGDGGVQDIDVNREINWCSCMRTEQKSSQMTKYDQNGKSGTPAGPTTSFHNCTTTFPSKKQEAESISRCGSSRLFPASSDDINTGWHTAFMNILPSKNRASEPKVKVS